MVTKLDNQEAPKLLPVYRAIKIRREDDERIQKYAQEHHLKYAQVLKSLVLTKLDEIEKKEGSH
jgi:hypothetical protein